MSESMIERATQAVFDAENGIDGDTIGDMLDEAVPATDPVEARAQVMRVCERAVLAVIAVLREPIEAMVEAGR